MLNKLIAFAAIFLLISCQHNSKNSTRDDSAAEKIKNDESYHSVDDELKNSEPYQTVENEQQALDLNKQTEAAIQEIEVQDRIFFSFDSSELSDVAKKILDAQVLWLKSDTKIKVTVEGHCDERGTREYNIALGEKRALSARNYLIENGVDKSRIAIVSYGKERPAFLGNSEEVFAKNRRAVTVVN